MDNRIDKMQTQLNQMQRELNSLRIDLRRVKKRDDKYVQVSYCTPTAMDETRWDYIDGIGNLKVGDWVYAPTRYGSRDAIVVKLGRSYQYSGPLSTITRRR